MKTLFMSTITSRTARATGGLSRFFHNPDRWQKLWQQISKRDEYGGVS